MNRGRNLGAALPWYILSIISLCLFPVSGTFQTSGSGFFGSSGSAGWSWDSGSGSSDSSGGWEWGGGDSGGWDSGGGDSGSWDSGGGDSGGW